MYLGCTECVTTKYQIYPIAILMGAGGSAMLITSLAVVASLIANNIGKYNTNGFLILKKIKNKLINKEGT